ncbi:hypothetical protein R6Q59_009487 [Mikania micrantha]
MKEYTSPKTPENHFRNTLMMASTSEDPILISKKPMEILGKIRDNKPVIIMKQDPQKITQESLLCSVNNLREAESVFVNKNLIFPSRKFEGEVRATIFPGCKPVKVYDLFCKGLIDCVYPSKDLEEIRYFPDKLKKEIKRFINNVKRDEIYLKFWSTILDWNEKKEVLLPYHLVQLGAKGETKELVEPTPVKPLNFEDLVYERASGYFYIRNQLRFSITRSNIRVNYCTPNLLVFSLSSQETREKDMNLLKNWSQLVETVNLNLSKATREIIANAIIENEKEKKTKRKR